MASYLWYEMTHAAYAPARALADMTRLYFKNPLNPFGQTAFGKQMAASAEVFERMTRRYGKPDFCLESTMIKGRRVPVHINSVWERPFCRLLHFERVLPAGHPQDPKVLVVAPMSGHYATLLRGTVEAILPDHDVYITDWADARMVPFSEGPFNLDDFIDYLISMQHFLGGQNHMVAVCQPSVPVLASVALMETWKDPYTPLSMVLMGGPIDTRINPTEVNLLAEDKGLDWFRRNVITQVPFPHPGFMRSVYPGFLQLSGFMSMNLDRHITAHKEFFNHLVEGDGDSAEKHRDFYDEYLAVMDLTAEFYLQTVDTVFIRHALPKGEMMHREHKVDCSAITSCALMTIEGEKDDITGRGQTKAAHSLCTQLPDSHKVHYEQPSVGHYGVFNGSRFRSEILPRMADFFRNFERGNNPARKSAQRAPSLQADPEDMIDKKPSAKPSGANKENSAKEPAKSAEAAQAKTRDESIEAKARRSLEQLFLKQPKGQPDDLKQINGIGPKLEQLLNQQGLFHYWQLAEMDKKAIDILDDMLTFRGRIEREDWIGQAKKLARVLPASSS
jgi:poly(3-hydroxybutyrate) depolymerase